MLQKIFHITIGAGSSPDLSLGKHLNIVKAALLYADRAKLYSSAYDVVTTTLPRGKLTPAEQFEFLESTLPFLIPNEQERTKTQAQIQRMKNVLKKKFPSRKQLILRKQLQKEFEERWETKVKDKFAFLAQDQTLGEFDTAVNSGLLEIHSFEALRGTEKRAIISELQDVTQKVAKEFVELVVNAVSDVSTYPLFDDETGELVRLGIQEGVISPSRVQIARGKQGQLGTNLLERLPLFERASVNEILDIRKELERYLIRFRSAVIKYSEKVETASWDKDFPLEVEQVFRRDVEPSILDIEDTVKSNSYLATLITRKIIGKPLNLASGTIAFAVAQHSALPSIASIALGAAVGIGGAVFDAYKERQKQKQSVEQNQLFFYYQAGKRLNNLA